MKIKNLSFISRIILIVAIFPCAALALPSKDDARDACISVMERTTLDPVIAGFYGEQLSNIAVRNCIVVVGEANGDPKRAKEVASKLKKDFGKSMWQMVGSPYATQQEKSMAVTMEGWHSSVMNKAETIAGNYGLLQKEAERLRSSNSR